MEGWHNQWSSTEKGKFRTREEGVREEDRTERGRYREEEEDKNINRKKNTYRVREKGAVALLLI